MAGSAVGAGAAVLAATAAYGPGLTADSAEYLAAANGLLGGEGLRRVDGSPFLHWPPLYPLLLPGLGGLSL